MNKKRITLFLLFVLLFSSCGIEGITELRELNPPLGLTGISTNGQITLRFYSSNPEEYFSGFNVYIANTIEDLRNNSGIKMPNTDYDANKPTIWQNINPSSNVVIYHITFIEKNNYEPFQAGLSYSFEVEAFSQEYNISSPPSNITNVIFSTN